MFIRNIIRLPLLLLIFTLQWHVSVNAATVGFANEGSLIPVADVNVTEGSRFFLDIVGNDFIEFAGGIINISFNPDVVRIESVAINETLFAFFPQGGELSPTSPGVWEGIAFDVNRLAIPPDPYATGDFTIASIEMTAIALGSSTLDILANSEFFDGTSLITPTLSGTNISSIPVPAALWLFLSGIAFMAARVKR